MMETEVNNYPIESVSKTSTSEIPTPKKPKNITKILLVIIGFLLVVIGLLGFQIIRNSDTTNYFGPTNTPTASPANSTPNLSATEELVFLENGQLWLLSTNGEKSAITDNNNVISFSTSLDNRYVGYIEGLRKESNGSFYLTPVEARLIDTRTDIDTLLLEMEPTNPYTNQEFSLQIRDVEVTNEGDVVSITTSESMYLHDIASKNLKMIFESKFNDTDPNLQYIYAYADPILNPDRSLAVVKKGYYEGNGYILIDLTNGEILNNDLPLTAYIEGKYPIDFLDNENLLISSYKSSYGYGDPIEDNVSLVQKGSVNNLENLEELHSLVGSSALDIDNTSLFENSLIIGTYSDKFNDEPPYNQERTIYQIYKYDLTSKMETMLFEIVNERLDTSTTQYSVAGFKQSGNNIYVLLVTNSNGHNIPGKIIKIDMNTLQQIEIHSGTNLDL